MEAVIKRSMLNPLASCFVPSNIKIFENTTAKSPNIKKDYYKSVVDETSSAVMKFNPVSHPGKRKSAKKLGIFMASKSDVISSKHYFVRLVNENMYFTKDYINWAPSKTTKCISWNATDVTALLRFPLVALLNFYNRQTRSVTYDVVYHEVADTLKEYKVEKCDCPPMFGCIVPPDFFGNPFGLNYSCNKKKAHVCHYSETSGIQTQKCNKEKELDKRRMSKLDQYSSELGEIVKDVCEMVSLAVDDDTGANSRYNEKINSIYEQNPTDCSDDQINGSCKRSNQNKSFNKVVAISNNTDNSNLENIGIVMEIPEDTPIVDDDFHPLLDEAIAVESDDEGISHVLEETIDDSFSLKYKRLRSAFDPEENPEKVACNPPCSVWCDSLPQPGKKLNLSEVEQDFSNKPRSCTSTISRPFYKRSFSENDSFMPENLESFLDVSNENMVRKHAKSYVKPSHLNETMKVRRCQSLPLSELPVIIKSGISRLNHSKDNKSMWGPFDDEDSLWQPLPDCAPLNEHNLKQSTQKRVSVREMKSQWSLT